MQQHQITSLIDDLKKIRDLLPTTDLYSEVPESPEIVVLYLNANRGLIEFCLEKVYKDRTREQRMEMCKSHPGLDESVADDESYDMASHPLWCAENSFMLEPRVERQHITMLINALEYAKYCVVSEGIRKLFMHPLEEYLS
ncbi:MAG TPA: hypothetical protein VF546_25300 [Pyrinomonadaceae bacterium]|jgi:hypothetical protein